MTNTEILAKYTTIRRNGSTVPSMNTFVITQVQVTESGRLVRYVARNPETGAMISINEREAASWHVVS